MTPAYRTPMSAFRPFVRALQLPWSKPQRGNLVRLGTAFCQERSLPLRRLARGLAGPRQAHRAADHRFRRFLGNDQLGLTKASQRWTLVTNLPEAQLPEATRLYRHPERFREADAPG